MKKLMATLLVLTMCVSMTSLAYAEAPSYLNVESNSVDMPIVKEGEDVTLNVVISQAATQGKAEDIWLWEYFRREHNIKINVEQVQDANEYKNLAFASGDLPDIVINMNLATADLVTYGMEEGMLLPIDQYIDGYMPNLKALYGEHPEWKEKIVAPDGHIYGMGQISDPNDETRNSSIHIYIKWLEELGLKIPQTMDEFMEVMRAFKKAHPEGVPFNGGYNADNPSLILLTGLGYVTNDAKALSPALRNGQVVFPYGDKEAYPEFLRLMNTLYTEDLMSHDFYSLTATDNKANVSMGLAGLYTGAPWSASPDVYMDWNAATPLTSAYNTTKVWPNNSGAFTVSRWSISSKTKYPELCCKLLDFFFNHKGLVLAFYGPMTGGEYDTYGMTSGWHWDDKLKWIVYDDIVNDKENRYGGMENPYRQQKIMLYTGVQLGDIRTFFEDVAAMAKADYKRVWSYDSLDFRHYAGIVDNIKPYFTEGYPGVVFFPQEINQRITDLKSVINAYVESESAKFVTGARPLTQEELDKYFIELDSLGYQEYMKYYVDYYAERAAK